MRYRWSIIIVHRSGVDMLRNMVASALQAASENDEIIIVDNGSDDELVQELSESHRKIRVIRHNCNAGYGFCCNRAMEIAKGTFFLLCNNDVQIRKNTLDEFEEVFINAPDIGMVGPQMYSPDGKRMNSFGGYPTLYSQLDMIGRMPKRKIAHMTDVGTIRGACLAVRESATQSVGLYDEDFYFYFEETEWCVRMRRNGWRVVGAPMIQVTHIGGASTKKVFSASRIEFFRARLLFWDKVFPRWKSMLIKAWNIPRLYIDWIFYFMLAAALAFKSERHNRKFTDRHVVISWFLTGKCDDKGLPGKCTQAELNMYRSRKSSD